MQGIRFRYDDKLPIDFIKGHSSTVVAEINAIIKDFRGDRVMATGGYYSEDANGVLTPIQGLTISKTFAAKAYEAIVGKIVENVNGRFNEEVFFIEKAAPALLEDETKDGVWKTQAAKWKLIPKPVVK